MLREQLRDCVRGLRVAGAREPMALFTAQAGAISDAVALNQKLDELGLSAEARGPIILICPTRALAQALAARGECWAAQQALEKECMCGTEAAATRPHGSEKCAQSAAACAAQMLPKLIEACGAPAAVHQVCALVRELGALARGWNEDDLALVARGLRLIEGPCDAAQRWAYARDVRRRAALALRTGMAGDALRACAYIMALGGIVI